MSAKTVAAVAAGSFVLGVLATLAVIGLGSLQEGEIPAQGSPQVAASAPPPPPPREAAPTRRPADSNVIINGRPLGASELRGFVSQYGVEPAPGAYWYDADSGLYGVAGMASAGFLLPGHEFGPLLADASRGNTGVFLNGRNLPQDELFLLNAIWGTYIQPGRYWLDGMGNVGYEGIAVPTGNLIVQLQMRPQVGAGGGAGGGDNIWSSRLGAGNYNADNSQGYLSVPGYGPIGYGFD